MNKNVRDFSWVIGSLLVIGLFLAIQFRPPTLTEDELHQVPAKRDSARFRKGMAQVMCQQFVEDQLKAPSTAKFLWQERVVVQEPTNPAIWYVKGKLDSQNSFGAMIRSTFRCKLEHAGGDTWNPLQVVVE